MKLQDHYELTFVKFQGIKYQQRSKLYLKCIEAISILGFTKVSDPVVGYLKHKVSQLMSTVEIFQLLSIPAYREIQSIMQLRQQQQHSVEWRSSYMPLSKLYPLIKKWKKSGKTNRATWTYWLSFNFGYLFFSHIIFSSYTV